MAFSTMGEIMDFNLECKRKGELLDLFWDLQENERKEMAVARRKVPHLKYDKMFKGVAFVKTIESNSVRLIRDNGQVIKTLEITPKISALLKPQDHFCLIAGRRQGVWRVIAMQVIGTEFERKPGQDPKFHMSGMNPLKNLLRQHLN